MVKPVLAALLFMILSHLVQAVPPDSARSVKLQRPYQFRLTTRLSSAGMFSYTGRIISPNPALDFNFNYERKTWGFMAFKATDLVDHLSDNNFALTALYKNFRIGKQLTVTPYAGFVLEQTRKIAGQGSDAILIVNIAYKISPHWSIDNSSLFSNLALESDNFDWVNRFRVLFAEHHVEAALICWHNNHVFNDNSYFSMGFNFTYGRIKLSEKVYVNTGVTGLAMIQTSDPETYPKKKGLVFTLGIVYHR